MTILNVLYYPDPRLRTKAKLVENFDESLQTLISDMFETMYEHNGVGLAATQVDVHKRIFILDTSDDKSQPQIFINPDILEIREVKDWMEGCVSFPDVFGKTKRGLYVNVRYQDQNGETHEKEAHGLEAVGVQHETDHLNGDLLVDFVSPITRMRIEKRMQKLKKKRL